MGRHEHKMIASAIRTLLCAETGPCPRNNQGVPVCACTKQGSDAGMHMQVHRAACCMADGFGLARCVSAPAATKLLTMGQATSV